MNVTVNGETRELAEGQTVADLLEALGRLTGRVAVEVNTQVVPRATYGEHRLADGDRVEVVTFVGGG